MKVVTLLLLLVLTTMIAEDVVSAHATPLQDSEKIISFLNHIPSDTQPVDFHLPQSRDHSHFGHCSFLLLSPLASLDLQTPEPLPKPYYSFTLKLAQPNSSLQPPIV